MTDIFKKLDDFFLRKLWTDAAKANRHKLFFIKSIRLFYIAVREFTEGELTLRAMSLVYTTLLAFAPLLAVSFSVLKAFGVHNQVEPLLQNFLTPLGPKGIEITHNIIGFVENIRVGILGSVGLALLIYTVISLIQKIEETLNYIWKINTPRSFARRFSDYMSVILIGPVLIFSAIGLTASVMSTSLAQDIMSIKFIGAAVYFTGKLIPYVFVCAAFTFVYIFVPNTKVNLSSALTGGIISGILWESAGWAFASFIVSSIKYDAIYSGFAVVIVFMIWLYLSWLILLVGADIAFYHQYPEFINSNRDKLHLSNRLKERLAIWIMYLIGRNFFYNKDPWTLTSLTEHIGLSAKPVHYVLNILEEKGFVIEAGNNMPAYLPKRDISVITINEILSSVRKAEEGYVQAAGKSLSVKAVDKVLEKIDNALQDSLGGATIKDLVSSSESRD